MCIVISVGICIKCLLFFVFIALVLCKLSRESEKNATTHVPFHFHCPVAQCEGNKYMITSNDFFSPYRNLFILKNIFEHCNRFKKRSFRLFLFYSFFSCASLSFYQKWKISYYFFFAAMMQWKIRQDIYKKRSISFNSFTVNLAFPWLIICVPFFFFF